MAVYAIGDIQGCYDELRALLKKIHFHADRDKLWFCGDLINRGPKSLETLRYLYSLKDNIHVVLGNHDLHLLATAYNHRHPGKKDTIDRILDANDANTLLEWVRHFPLLHYDDELKLLMVHAGLYPRWSIATALKLAAEVEVLLRGREHIDFYKHMYGDKPANWSDDLAGWSRYRFITNIFTRLRYCDLQGKPVLTAKGPPGSQAKHLLPWFEIPDRLSETRTVIFGHWSTLPQAGRTAVHNTRPLDSGCLWGGKLTAMRIDDHSFDYVRHSCPGALNPGGYL